MSLTLPGNAGRAPDHDGPTIDGAYPGDEMALLSTLVRYFEESEYSSYDARNLAEKCRDYFDGRQYTPAEIATLERRRQPPVINNYVKRKVELLRGLERRGRSDPKAFPRTPTEDNRADAATQALRYVADDQRYDVTRSAVFDNILIEGYGGVEVIVEPNDTDGGFDVVINHVPWDRLFYDPHSRDPGFTDARYLGCVIWKDRDDALDTYPGCEDILDSTFDSGHSETFDDRPHQRWCDLTRRRVRIAQIHWKLRDDWWTATFTRGGFLEKPVKSPYIGRRGHRSCPLILRSAYCDRDLNRYGIVKDMLSPQDSINKRESKLMHSLNVNRIIAAKGAVEDVDKARAEAAKPDGYLEVNPDMRFEIGKDTAEIAGQFQLLQYTVGQMNVTGPNASMAGKDPREQSGRAIIAQQTGGQVEHEPIADALRQHTHKVFEAVWMRIKQYWTDPKWVRITDTDKNVKFVGLNQPLTIADLLSRVDMTQPVDAQLAALPARDRQAVQVGMRLAPNDPRLQTFVRTENDVSDIDVSIDIEEGPDNPTMEAEQFQSIMQLPPQILMQIPPAVIIQASSLRNKDQLIKMLEEHQASQASAQDAAKQLAQKGAAANVAKTEAQAGDLHAQTIERLHNMAMDHDARPLNRVEQLHGMAMDHAAASAPPDNGLMTPSQGPPPVDPLAAADQAHTQAMDTAQLGLAAQQQGHDQMMDVAGHGLAVAQAQHAAQAPAPGGA
jgi:hypothetical protein